MKYQVAIGLSKEIKLTTDGISDVIDLSCICLNNGYRVSIIPVGDDFEEIIKGEFDELEKEEAKKLGMGERIKECLDGLGMSQRELAAKCKCTEVTISRYISGDRTPKGPIIVLIAKALGVSTDWLLGM